MWKPRLSYVVSLWREGVWGKWIGGTWALVGYGVFVRDDLWRPKEEAKYKAVALIPHLPIAWWVVGLLVILVGWVFEASFRRQAVTQKQLEIERWVDRGDIGKIGHGVVLGNSFIAGQDGFIALNLTGPSQLHALASGDFHRIPTNCPKGSVARGRIQFFDIRQSGRSEFYTRDAKGDVRRIEDRSNMRVAVGDDHSFDFKIVLEQGHAWPENASLQVWLEGWTK